MGFGFFFLKKRKKERRPLICGYLGRRVISLVDSTGHAGGIYCQYFIKLQPILV